MKESNKLFIFSFFNEIKYLPPWLSICNGFFTFLLGLAVIGTFYCMENVAQNDIENEKSSDIISGAIIFSCQYLRWNSLHQ